MDEKLEMIQAAQAVQAEQQAAKAAPAAQQAEQPAAEQAAPPETPDDSGKKNKNKKNKKSKDKSKKKKKKNSKLTNILLVLFICIGLFAAYNILKILKGYYDDQNAYNKVSEIANGDEFTGIIDFAKLAETNPDVIAWIYLKDTKINYPVVQGDDNNKYLKHMFDGTYSDAGTLFVDYQIPTPFEQFDTIIYGHHMKDSSMFGGLKAFKDSDYAKEHSRLELITPTAKYHLDVVGFVHTGDDSSLYIMNQSASTYDSILRSELSYQIADWTTSDKLVLMSTCAYEYDGARYILVGKLTPWTKSEIKKAELKQLKLDQAKKN